MKKRSLVSIFAALAVLVSASCDSARTIAGTDLDRSSVIDYRWAQPVSTVITTTDNTTTTTVVAIVGRNGGKIENGNHLLIIPNRAVLSDTEFTFTMVGGNHIHADLSAKTVVGGVPVSTFKEALTLRLSYAGANVTDPSKLVIAYLVDGTTSGVKQRLSTIVSTSAQTVTSYLSHFSGYVIGTD